MANDDDFVPERRPAIPAQPGEIWPGSGIIIPGWDPNGVLGGIRDIYPPHETLGLLLSPEDRATIGAEEDSNQSADGLNGVRPPGWDDHGGGQAAPSLDQIDPDRLAPGRPAGNYYGDYLPHGLRTPIGPVPGYPESGKNAWRGSLDDQVTMGANNYNAEYGLQPGDPLYLTPLLVKSWAMQESGGSDKQSRLAFGTDTMQANAKPGDWDKEKVKYGMSLGQKMTPMASINGGLGWLHYKAEQLMKRHPAQPVTIFDALKAYNGNPKTDPNGLPHNVNYANSILGRMGYGQK